MNLADHVLRRAATALAFLCIVSPGARAQSLTSGVIEGVVRDAAGVPLADVVVLVSHARSGVARGATTARDGRFEVGFLPPGEYVARAERLGYRPQRIEGVPVRPGERRSIAFALSPAAPPVETVDVEQFGPTAAGGGVGPAALGPDRLPIDGRELRELARLSSHFDPDLAGLGLPSRSTGLVLDGLSHGSVGHAALGGDAFPDAAVALSSLGYAEVGLGAYDVELPGFAGGHVAATTRQGTRELEVRAFGDWSGDALTSSKYFDAGEASRSSYQGGILVTGPLLRDTAHFAIGLEVQHRESAFPRAWEIDSIGSTIRTVALDSFAVDLGGYGGPRVLVSDRVAGFVRLDWQVAQRHTLTLRGNVASLPSVEVEPGSGGTGIGAVAEGKDAAVAAILTSVLSDRLSQEIRVGAIRSDREFTAAGGVDGVPATWIAAGGFGFGAYPPSPVRLDRTGIEATQVFQLRRGRHRLEAGVIARYDSYGGDYGFGGGSSFFFSDGDAFARGEGVLSRVDEVSTDDFSVPRYGLLFQDTWSPLPGLALSGGFRLEVERLPAGDVRSDDGWRTLTGLSNDGMPSSVSMLGPRFGFVWDVQERNRWVIRGGAGIFDEGVDPAVLGELLARDGRATVRRLAGTLPGWPAVPDPTTLPDHGPTLALLAREFRGPRSIRADLGIVRRVRRGTAVRLSAAYRRTDFLTRREDLNRLPSPAAVDQYGRPVFGTLVEVGGIVAAEPGTNRRFPEYDIVSALNADGRSEYWGFTAGLEHASAGPLSIFGSYTYSRTEDDWLGAGAGVPEDALDPFPVDGVAGADWATGTSDFDAPHRVVAGAELRLPGGFRIAGLYRYRSGIPFTPGFRDGVDANGDGSARNDPAFVDDQVPGVPELIDEWECLRDQVGRFAERNACRGEGLHSLDLRLGIGALRAGRVRTEIVVDAFNLMEPDIGLPDRALYLVDGTQPLVVDDAAGRVTVPLVANPHFGRPLTRWTPGRVLRLGLRVNY